MLLFKFLYIAIEPVKVYFELNSKIFFNNSVASFLEIGEGDSALVCKTNKVECCGTRPNRYGEFYYPNGERVPVVGLAGGAELYCNGGTRSSISTGGVVLCLLMVSITVKSLMMVMSCRKYLSLSTDLPEKD